jgi:hypothetical protein
MATPTADEAAVLAFLEDRNGASTDSVARALGWWPEQASRVLDDLQFAGRVLCLSHGNYLNNRRGRRRP